MVGHGGAPMKSLKVLSLKEHAQRGWPKPRFTRFLYCGFVLVFIYTIFQNGHSIASTVSTTGSSSCIRRYLLVGHELSLTDAPLALREVYKALMSDPCIDLDLLFLKGGPLEEEVQRLGLRYQIGAELMDHGPYSAILLNTVTLDHSHWGYWVRDQVAAFGQDFIQKLVWWVHEVPQEYPGSTIVMAVLVTCPHVIFDSHFSRQMWEHHIRKALERGRSDPMLGLHLTELGSLRPLILPRALMEDATEVLSRAPRLLNFKVIHPGVEDVFVEGSCHNRAAKRASGRSMLRIPQTDYVLLWIGSLHATEGVLELIQAFLALRHQGEEGGLQLRLSYASADLDYLHRIKELINGSALVHLEEGRDKANIRPLYAAADVVVSNSKCQNIELGTLEAMAAGLPVLAVACGGALETVSHRQTGLHHPVMTDVSTLARHMAALDVRLPDGALLGSQMGRRGCEQVRRRFVNSKHANPQLLAVLIETSQLQIEQTYSGTSSNSTFLQQGGWFKWELLESLKSMTFESPSSQVGRYLWAWGGYDQDAGLANINLTAVDTEALKIAYTGPSPGNLPQTHVSLTQDGRHFYAVAGQAGPKCSLSVSTAYSFDTWTKVWAPLPDLPKPRYAGGLGLVDRQLHYVGGTDTDRFSSTKDHWVLDLDRVSHSWRQIGGNDIHIPGHVSLVSGLFNAEINGTTMYAFGGANGDHVPNDPQKGDFNCGMKLEASMPDIHAWLHGAWVKVASFPVGLSHVESCTIRISSTRVLFFGGSHMTNWQSNIVYMYDSLVNRVSVVGYTPMRMRRKGALCFRSGESVVVLGGQLGGQGGFDPIPGLLTKDAYIATLPREILTGH